MKKIIIEKPIYETVQTGVRKEEKWQTSDGKIHDDERSALYHEFYNLKVNMRGFHIEELERATVLDLTCREDLEKYEKDYIYKDCIKYDKDKLTYPNTYVFYEVDEREEDDYYSYPEYYVYCMPLNEFKKMLIKKIQEFK